MVQLHLRLQLSYAVITPSANQSADGRRAARSATTYQPIRIHVEYDTALKLVGRTE